MVREDFLAASGVLGHGKAVREVKGKEVTAILGRFEINTGGVKAGFIFPFQLVGEKARHSLGGYRSSFIEFSVALFA